MDFYLGQMEKWHPLLLHTYSIENGQLIFFFFFVAASNL